MEDRKHKDVIFLAKIYNGCMPDSFQVGGPVNPKGKRRFSTAFWSFTLEAGVLFNVSISSKCLSCKLTVNVS